MMNEEEVAKLFERGIVCSQICLSELSEEVGLDEAMAKRMAALFGGGAWCGEMCGAVSGCLMALGMRYGHHELDDAAQRELGMKKLMEFKQRFENEYGSIVCREILGYDLSKPEEMRIIQEKGFFVNKCPRLVCRAVEMAREVL